MFIAIIFLLKIKEPGGRVFYKHKRLKKDGDNFFCIKFRTMTLDADQRLETLLKESKDAREEYVNSFKLKNDPRIISGIGDFLRNTSFDEFPQLFNVIKGDMSLVGPRPIVESEKEKYKDILDDLLTVKPGLTGLWQVSGRSDLSYKTRIELDKYYIENQSFFLDFKIIVLTFKAMFGKKGAY